MKGNKNEKKTTKCDTYFCWLIAANRIVNYDTQKVVEKACVLHQVTVKIIAKNVQETLEILIAIITFTFAVNLAVYNL